MTKAQKIERDSAREDLLKKLKPGNTVWTNLVHVSRSGMYRVIDCFIIRDNSPRRISWLVAKAIGFRYDRRHEGVAVSGCGMDMGFHLVYSLSRVLFPTGHGCIGKHCPSNDHFNGDRDYTIDGFARKDSNGDETVMHWHREGGYALCHRWI